MTTGKHLVFMFDAGGNESFVVGLCMEIGAEFGLTIGRVPDGCIRCRLCMRVCKEVIGARALTMVKRGGVNYVVPSEKGVCIGCGTCANICPTHAIRLEDKGNVRTMLVGDQVIATADPV